MHSLLPSLARLRLAPTGAPPPSRGSKAAAAPPPPQNLPTRKSGSGPGRGSPPGWLPAACTGTGAGNHPASVPAHIWCGARAKRARLRALLKAAARTPPRIPSNPMQRKMREAALAPRARRGEAATVRRIAPSPVENAEADWALGEDSDGEVVRVDEDEDSEDAVVRRKRAGGSAKQRLSNAVQVDEDLDVCIATHPLGERLRDASSVVGDSTTLVEEHVYVKQGKDGPNEAFIKKFTAGLKRDFGWLVTATTEKDEAVWDLERGSETTLPNNTMVGVLLVAATDVKDGKWCEAHGGLRADVVSLGTHRLVRGKGVSPRLWDALLTAIALDSNTKMGKLTLTVEGGPCLNNDASRALYTKWGFCGPALANDGDSICGWTREFLDGQPVRAASLGP